jgi:uncharacterized protein (TIRG00374 family)
MRVETREEVEGRPSRPAAPVPSDEAAFPHFRWRTVLPALVLLTLAVHTLLPQLATLQTTADVLRRMRWWAVVLAVIAQGASYWGNTYTVQSVARLTGDWLGGWAAARLALAAGSIGVLSGGPVGYGAATYYWTRQRGMSRQGAVLCGWLPGIMNTMVLVGLTLAGVTHLLLRHLLGRSQLVSLGVLGLSVMILLLGGTWVLAREDRTATLGLRALHAWNRVRRRKTDSLAVAAAVERLVSSRRLIWRGGWRQPLLGAVANAGFDVVTLFCLFVATRQAIAPPALIAGYGLPQLVGRLTFLPGGLGITEGGMVGLYVALGVPATTAVLVVLAYRGLSFWLPTLIGFPLAAVLQHGSSFDRQSGYSHATTK